MTRSDDELFEALRDALVPSGLAPGPDEMRQFAAAIGHGQRGLSPRPAWRPHPAVPRLVAAGALLLAGIGALSGGVAADSLPGPLRAAAYDIGLPVSSPALVAAEAAETTLAVALAQRDRSAVATAISVLEQRAAALGADDRSTFMTRVGGLLAQAQEFLASTASPAPIPEIPGGSEEQTPQSTQPPETTEPSEIPEGSSSGSSSDSHDSGSPTSTSQPSSSQPSSSSDTGGDGGTGTGDASRNSFD